MGQGHVSMALAVLVAACGGDTRQLTPLERQLYLAPTPVATSLAFERVAAGYHSSCILTAGAEAWCWGSNAYGQLGAATTQTCSDGTVACTWQPVRAAAPLQFASFSMGLRHACGIDIAGQAWCWGFGQGGQLGDGQRRDSAAPVPLAGHRFVQIDAGRTSLVSCALDDAGVAWCWGPAGGGTLGNGTTDAADAPVAVAASQPYAWIGVGAEHACALDAGGAAWCWGRNAYGQLGSGAPEASLVPAAVTGGLRYASLAVGGDFTCGLTAAGAAWCWGVGGAIGAGAALPRSVPTPVSGGLVFARLSAGYQHACGLVADGTAWCWGPGVLIGADTEQPSHVPVPVAGGHRFAVLGAGGVATCGITLQGALLCWGINTHGAVGQANVDP